MTAAIVLAMVFASLMTLLSPSAAWAADIAGMSVFLDSGRGGINDSSISKQVSNGRGGTKDCGTTGTSTSDGYPEHSFNWDVAPRVRSALTLPGVHTEMSRAKTIPLAPCVDERAAAANAIRPDADISIHADGGPASRRGFHVNYSAPPLNDAQKDPSLQLATVMSDSLVAAGMQSSSDIGSDRLYGLADWRDPTLSSTPRCSSRSALCATLTTPPRWRRPTDVSGTPMPSRRGSSPISSRRLAPLRPFPSGRSCADGIDIVRTTAICLGSSLSRCRQRRCRHPCR